MICPFKVSAREGDVCGDCDAPFAPDMVCGLAKAPGLVGQPVSAGTAAMCDPSEGVCESCE